MKACVPLLFILALLVLTGAGGVRAACPVDLEAPRHYAASGDPYFVEKADFNKDGLLDLALSNKYDQSVVVLLGSRSGENGRFMFEEAVSCSISGRSNNLSLPDLNDDGILDIVVALRLEDGVQLLIGGGAAGVWDGTFSDGGFFYSGKGAYDTAVDDFNGDSIPDIAVAKDAYGTNVGDSVSVLIGTGEGGVWDGGFESAYGFPVDHTPQMVVSHDFNEDGAIDLVTANAHGSSVSVLLGVGDGTFLPRVDYTVGSGPHSVVVGDFNEDGIADLACSNWNHDNISVLLGNGEGGVGDGTFASSRGYSVGDAPRRIVVADLNGDGIDDLATCDYYGRTVTFVEGRGEGGVGNGLFRAGESFPAGGMAWSLVADDFDGDGAVDLVTANPKERGAGFLRGNGDGTFRTLGTATVGEGAGAIAAGDWNDDGIIDLAVACAAEDRVDVLLGGGALGTGDGTFEPDSFWAAGDGPAGLAAADVNGDGRLDLVTADRLSGTVSVLIGGGVGASGDGTFEPPVAYAVTDTPTAVVVADFNDDGIDDLAVSETKEDIVEVLIGNGSGGVGDGTFGTAQAFAVGDAPRALVAADFDEDGLNDLAIVCEWEDKLKVLINQSSGGGGDVVFAPPASYDAGDRPWGIAAADLDQDGVLDLAVTNMWSGEVAVFFGEGAGGIGTGQFEEAEFYTAGVRPAAVGAFDGNQDGILDLVVSDSLYGTLSILRGGRIGGAPNGVFEEAVAFCAGEGIVSMAAGHFNGDGGLDFAFAGPSFVAGSETRIEVVLSGPSPTGVAGSDSEGPPRVSSLRLAPNPFNGSLRIRFDLPRPGRAVVALFNSSGRRVRTLLDRPVSGGPHEVWWDGLSDFGRAAASGVYFVRLESDGLLLTEKAVFLR